MRGVWENVAMPNLAAFLFMVVPTWLSNRTRTPRLAIGAGTGNLVLRTDYDALGGHEPLHDAVVDDIALARLFRRGGRRTAVVRADDFVSVRMYEGGRAIVEGFTKNGFTTLGRSYTAVIVLLPLGLLVSVQPFVGALTGDPLSVASVATITAARVILFGALGYRIDSALFGHVPMMVLWTWIMIRSAWYTGIRRQLLWRGRTYDAARTRFGAD
jgi:chlorobactene glucosyltransferase